MSKRVTIVSRATDDAGLEAFLRALARALLGCRFAIATPDGSALLAALGDRFQVWPVRESIRPLAASLVRSDGLVFLGAPEGLRAQVRAVALAALASSRGLPAFLLAAPAAGSAAARSRLGDAFRRRVEPLPPGIEGAKAIARRLGSARPERGQRSRDQEPPARASTSTP